jgi:hypothetical protein
MHFASPLRGLAKHMQQFPIFRSQEEDVLFLPRIHFYDLAIATAAVHSLVGTGVRVLAVIA